MVQDLPDILGRSTHLDVDDVMKCDSGIRDSTTSRGRLPLHVRFLIREPIMRLPAHASCTLDVAGCSTPSQRASSQLEAVAASTAAMFEGLGWRLCMFSIAARDLPGIIKIVENCLHAFGTSG